MACLAAMRADPSVELAVFLQPESASLHGVKFLETFEIPKPTTTNLCVSGTP